MTVSEMAKQLSLTSVSMADGERNVSGVYIGDLLSWVMGRAQCGNVWITIMSNVNIVAVASLADVSCVVLAESVVPDEGVCKTAEQKGVNIFTTEKTAYQIAKELADLSL